MIELKTNRLVFTCPEVDPRASFSLDFQRTLRIPDDGGTYPLPPGLGSFPLRHVDDFAQRVPARWRTHGGVMLPMYQSEALWVSFGSGPVAYPFAVKIAAGKINAVSGADWSDGLTRRPQDYVVVPEQPWLDGYCVKKGVIRQFVAAPLGAGATAEEQLTGEAEFGGIQIVAYPMKAESYARLMASRGQETRFAPRAGSVHVSAAVLECDMGLAAGGQMRQEIEKDPYMLSDWDTEHASRCFVHLANSLAWRAITDQQPPTAPRTAADYERAGLPWFEYYGDGKALEGSKRLKSLKSVAELEAEQGTGLLPENESVSPKKIVGLGPKGKLAPGQVREGSF